MNDAQLLRYARHILLDGLGVEAQQRFLAASVLLVGAGGLGSAAALYLASAGVGRITVVDDDTVDLTNLQRQIAHTTERVGQGKAASIASAVAALNPDVTVDAVPVRATPERLAAWVQAADVVLDCTDNQATREAINAACVQACRPLVSGAAIGYDAQVAVYDPRDPASPCHACLYPPDGPPTEEADCATMGVFAPLVGIVGSLQAAEALKLLAPVGTTLVGRLLMLDARRMEWSELRSPRRPLCAVCGTGRVASGRTTDMRSQATFTDGG